MKALIVTGRGVQDQEFIYPYYRLQEAGYEVHVAVRRLTMQEWEFHGYQGVRFQRTRDIPDVREATWYQLLVIPGGVKAMEHMRLDDGLLAFVRAFHEAGGVVAAICSGVQLLISAGLVRGRRAAIYPAFRVDLENAGGEFVDMPAVVDDRIVTSPHYRHLGPWMAAALITVASQ